MRVKMTQPTPAASSSRTRARTTAPAVFMVLGCVLLLAAALDVKSVDAGIMTINSDARARRSALGERGDFGFSDGKLGAR